MLAVAFLGLFAASHGVRSDGATADDEAGGISSETGAAEAASGTDLSGPEDEASDRDSSGVSSLAGMEAATGPTQRREWRVDTDVSQTAKDVLGGYEARGDTTLARAGWLDLLGSVWGCAVVGPGWVDVCLVERQEDEGSCVVSLRMEVERWREAYGGSETGDG